MTYGARDVTLAMKRYRQWEVRVMDERSSRYDSDLEMFVEPSRDPDVDRLRFLRWLAERGLLEHRPAGAPAGDFAVQSTVTDGRVNLRTAA
jgi:hypothetical protein